MTPLAGHRVLALGSMPGRPLARFLESLGAEVIAGTPADGGGRYAFAIDDLGLPRLAAAGWDAAANPGLVHASVTCFGSHGPRRMWRGSELVASAAGGTLRLTGYRDRPPVKEALDACTCHADLVAAAGLMAAHYARAESGRGDHVDVSVQEVAFNRNVSGVLAWQFDRRKLARVGPALNYGLAQVRCIWPLADGYCFHTLMTGKFGAAANQALSDWIDESGQGNPIRGVDWLAYNRSTLAPETRAAWEAGIGRFFATRTKHEMATEGRRRGINACVVAEPGDVLGDPHLEARGFWELEAGRRAPGRFVRIVADGGGAGPRARMAAGEAGRVRGPLAGLKVLDFSWALVGSITTKTLGDLGATVVKVESRRRPCLSRVDIQVSASQPGQLDDKPWFAHLNTSKLSIALDMKHSRAMEVLRPLIDWADLVVENFSPGTMAKLGLDFAALTARNPRLVMLSGSVYGQTGPLAPEWGIDGTGGALSGRTFLTGWPDRDPVVPGSVPYGDVILPFAMAAAGLAVLEHGRTTGAGAHVDASMYELCVQQTRAAILAAQSGARPARSGNSDPAVAHQDVYPAAGDDRWVAVTCATADEVARLQALAGTEDIAAWTAGQRDHDIAAKLQAAGIAAAAVQDIEDLLDGDPTLAGRGALVELEHAILGRFGHVRTPLSFAAAKHEPFRAPSIGEHTVTVLSEFGGFSDAAIEALAAEKVFE
ncbi:MAG TPA: CoA transferase [Woeseiaceae bacterium]|nr:CoA transferase [Woeseiaceae bacterium]